MGDTKNKTRRINMESQEKKLGFTEFAETWGSLGYVGFCYRCRYRTLNRSWYSFPNRFNVIFPIFFYSVYFHLAITIGSVLSVQANLIFFLSYRRYRLFDWKVFVIDSVQLLSKYKKLK